MLLPVINRGHLSTTQRRSASAEWHTPASSKPETEKGQDKQIQSENNVIVFFDAKGVLHKEFVPQGQTVNAAY